MYLAFTAKMRDGNPECKSNSSKLGVIGGTYEKEVGISGTDRAGRVLV
jgi:hypothetical protein